VNVLAVLTTWSRKAAEDRMFTGYHYLSFGNPRIMMLSSPRNKKWVLLLLKWQRKEDQVSSLQQLHSQKPPLKRLALTRLLCLHCFITQEISIIACIQTHMHEKCWNSWKFAQYIIYIYSIQNGVRLKILSKYTCTLAPYKWTRVKLINFAPFKQ
jgi:hypothetical protein